MTKYRKSWTEVIEEVILNEALKPIDKSVIDAFYYKKEKEGKVVSTDGDTLTKMGIGGQQIAKWVGRKIKITAVSDVKSTESILKYMKKSIPSGILEEVTIGDVLDQIVEDAEIEESAVLQLKMAFDDAKIKIKGVKGGKLVIAKKDKKKVEGIISKQMKKPADAKRVLGSQIVFEDKGSVLTNYPHDSVPGGDEGEEEEEGKLAEKGTAYPATVDTLRKIVKDKQHQTVMFDKGQAMVDLFTASAMVQVYDALKPATKKKFEDMIKSKEGFMKSQAFAMKMAK